MILGIPIGILGIMVALVLFKNSYNLGKWLIFKPFTINHNGLDWLVIRCFSQRPGLDAHASQFHSPAWVFLSRQGCHIIPLDCKPLLEYISAKRCLKEALSHPKYGKRLIFPYLGFSKNPAGISYFLIQKILKKGENRYLNEIQGNLDMDLVRFMGLNPSSGFTHENFNMMINCYLDTYNEALHSRELKQMFHSMAPYGHYIMQESYLKKMVIAKNQIIPLLAKYLDVRKTTVHAIRNYVKVTGNNNIASLFQEDWSGFRPIKDLEKWTKFVDHLNGNSTHDQSTWEVLYTLFQHVENSMTKHHPIEDGFLSDMSFSLSDLKLEQYCDLVTLKKRQPEMVLAPFLGYTENHLYDVFQKLFNEVIFPLGLRQIEPSSRSKFVHAFIRQKGYIKTLTMSFHHSGMYRAPYMAGKEWLPILEKPEFVYNGLKFVPLLNSEELIQEGKNLTHCVGGYTYSCASYQSYIYSIRKNGISISTFEFVVDKMSPIKITIRQHRAMKNDVAPKEAQQALKAWEKSLSGNKVNQQVLLKKPIAKKSDKRSVEEELDEMYSDIWKTPEWQEARWQVWKPILKTSAKTPQEWMSGWSSELKSCFEP